MFTNKQEDETITEYLERVSDNPSIGLFPHRSITIDFDYDGDSNGICGRMYGSWEIPTRKEAMQIIDGLKKFYSFYSDSQIDAANLATRTRHLRESEERSQSIQSKDTPTRKKISGYIYLIRAENGLYKIGKTKDINKRMKPFAIHFPMKWELLHSFKSDDYTGAEMELHELFNNKRTVGEWFELDEQEASYIQNIKDGEM